MSGNVALPVENLFGHCVALHQEGKLEEAAAGYQRILREFPQHCDALHLLGVVAQQKQRYDLAIDLMKAAVAMNIGVPQYHNNLGNTYLLDSNPQEAVESYKRALSLDPTYFEAHLGLGNAWAAMQKFELAMKSYRDALALNPSSAEAHYYVGKMHIEVGETAKAIDEYHAAICLNRTHYEFFRDLGAALAKEQRYSEATEAYREALCLNPEDETTLLEIASIYRAASNDLEAARAYTLAGRLLQRKGMLIPAAASFEQAIEVRPTFAEAYQELATVQMQLGEFEKAETLYKRILELPASCKDVSPNQHLAALVDLGICFDTQNKLEEAQETYRKFLRIQPDNASIHTNLAYALLSSGKYTKGWQEHEWRWGAVGFPSKRKDFGRPQWKGEPLNGEAILLYWEQGYGDTLQLARYIPLVAERGGRAILDVQPALRNLLSSLPGVAQFIAEGDPLPEFSWQCPLMSLPYAFGTTVNTIPSSPAYLSISPEEVRKAKTLWPSPNLRVGLAWQGSPSHPLDASRSMRLQQLECLKGVPGVAFYSLQVGSACEQLREVGSDFGITDVCSGYKDFQETAAFVAGLDLVITVDTVIAHLAGGLGVPTWVLLPQLRPDWRWLRERDDSPWYPLTRLFRQTVAGDWQPVTQAVRQELLFLVSHAEDAHTVKECDE